MAEDLDNRVFRCIEGKARGYLPFLPWEGLVGFLVGIVGVALVHLFVGIILGTGVIGALVAWRQKDADRSDYVEVWWRRRSMRTRTYSPAEPDQEFVSLEHLEK